VCLVNNIATGITKEYIKRSSHTFYKFSATQSLSIILILIMSAYIYFLFSVLFEPHISLKIVNAYSAPLLPATHTVHITFSIFFNYLIRLHKSQLQFRGRTNSILVNVRAEINWSKSVKHLKYWIVVEKVNQIKVNQFSWSIQDVNIFHYPHYIWRLYEVIFYLYSLYCPGETWRNLHCTYTMDSRMNPGNIQYCST
jgi:hypothetical protein